MTGIGDLVAAAIKRALPGRTPQVKREKCHEADADALMLIPDKQRWFAEVAASARERMKGEPSELAIKAVGNCLWFCWTTGQRMTHKAMAAFIGHGCKRENVRRCLEFLCVRGAVAIINVMKRAADGWHRAANLYLPARMLINTDVGPRRVSRRYFAKVADFFNELAPKLGVMWNTFGYERTPLRMPPLLPGEI